MGEALKRYSLDKKFKKEMIDGEIYLMASPCREHVDVQANLITIFNSYFKQNGKRCISRGELQLNINEKNYFEPDVQVFCKNNNNGNIPVIVIEILSASTAKKDLGVKMKKYAELGIKEYWIITWQISTIAVYLLNEKAEYELQNIYSLSEDYKPDNDDDIPAKEFSALSFPELNIKLSDVFDFFDE
jgi:Uma2 family endonuclease